MKTVAFRSRWHNRLRYRRREDPPETRWDHLDLTKALRILEQAGCRNPMKGGAGRWDKLQALIDALCDLSLQDGLTGLVNATFFQATLTSELDRSSRTGRTCGLLLIDLDHFKAVNDDYGHHVGDMVLQAVARRMKNSLRSMDTAARIGGEEFAVILPECTPEDAIRAARRIHGTLNPLAVDTGKATVSITTSAGLVWTDTRQTSNTTALLRKADRELYRAKRLGRQRLCYPSVSTTLVSSDERAALVMPRLEEENHGQ